MHAEELLADRELQLGEAGAHLEAHGLEENLAGQRIAVGVQAGRGEPMRTSPHADLGAVQHLRAVDHADDGAGDIVFPAWYMPGIWAVSPPIRAQLPARQALAKRSGADGRPAARASGGDVIEEEKRLCSDDGDVVDAVVDEILADRVVLVDHEGDLKLVPTPSTLATSTGSFILPKSARKRPPKPPILPSTCGP